MPSALIFVIFLALVFEFTNGMRESSNIMATVISSRAFSPRAALGMTVIAEFIGPFLFGVTVAKTVGSDIVSSDALTFQSLGAGLAAAVVWNLGAWLLGIPSSSSHSLLGGLVGAAVISSGWAAVKFSGLTKVLLALFISPAVSFIAGFLLLKMVYFLSQRATPRINNFFRQSQLVTAVALAFSHGANGAQKTIGMITLSLVIGGRLADFSTPLWVIALSAGAMLTGTFLGGWRLIRTLGGKFYKIRPVHSFSTQLTSALVIFGASMVGLPVSTSQVVSSAIIGVGASERLGKVRWSVAEDIVTAWVLTVPGSALLGAGIYWLAALLS